MGKMFIYFVILNLVWCLVSSSSVGDIPNGIKDMPSENKNRIRGKHLEMWDIILSILERKETLQNILKIHYSLPEKIDANNLKITPTCGQDCNRDSLEKLNKTESNYLEQLYNLNVDVSTLILKELSKLSELERQIQTLV